MLLQWFVFVWFMLYKQGIIHVDFTVNLELIHRKTEFQTVTLEA